MIGHRPPYGGPSVGTIFLLDWKPYYSLCKTAEQRRKRGLWQRRRDPKTVMRGSVLEALDVLTLNDNKQEAFEM